MNRCLFKISLLFFNLVFLISFSQNDTLVAQRDLKDVYFKVFKKGDTVPPSRNFNDKKAVFSLIPAEQSSAGADRALVISFMTSFYLSESEDTKMSAISFTPSFTFSNQYIFPIQSYIFTKGNAYILTGDYRYMIYPQSTYGIGSNNYEEVQSLLDYQQWRVYQYVARRVKNNLYLGLGFLMDNYKNISEESYVTEETDYVKYMNNDFSDEMAIGFAFQTIYDSRDNITNPSEGYFLEFDYKFNTKFNDNMSDYSSIYFDLRKYLSFSKTKHRVWANKFFWWNTFDGNPHYLDLPSIGWDHYQKTGRGFTRNRFRSNALVYLESEYRTDLTKDGLLGAVFFANISSVSNIDTYEFEKINPAVGTGLRIKWSKRNNSNLSLDLGFSQYDVTFRVGFYENF